MSNPKYTAICLLVDRSGSMGPRRESAQDAINEFVASQRDRDGRTTIRIVQFDAPREHDFTGPHVVERTRGDWYLVHCPSTDAADVPAFTLHPRGMTALYDAMGTAIAEFGAELAALPEDDRPGTVVFAVLTDGKENSSREYKSTQIKKIVEAQTRDYNWHFTYLGANQDAVLEGEKMGIPRASSITYDASDGGTRAVITSMSESVAYAASSGGPIRYSEAQRRRAAGKGK